MVDVEVGEGLFEVVLSKNLLELESRHDELRKVNVSRTVGVNYPHQQTHTVL
jgi:hypothetical protein